MQLQYTGQFAQFEGQELRSILEDQRAIGEPYWCTADALDVLSARSWQEVDLIARRINAVVRWSAAGEIETARPEREAADYEIDALRRMLGDVHLWLEAAGEMAPEPPDATPIPAAVTRAEYLAVLALWKSWQLEEAINVIVGVVQEVRDDDAGMAYPAPAERLTAAVLSPVHGMLTVAGFSAELAKAAAMAVETELLEDRVASARQEVAAAFEDVRKQQHRQRSSKGGSNKAKSYQPAREKILRLYVEGGYKGSRAAAVDDIYQKLLNAGDAMPHSRVKRTVEAYDLAATKPDAAAPRSAGARSK